MAAQKTVLAIDDSLTIRELINFVLGNAGFKVVLAEDGIEGLEQLSRCKPDIIITDVNMPRLDGLSFIERARGEGGQARSTPILVLTTESSAELKTRAKAAGATGWIVKPFNPVQLIEAIQRVAP
jgi:two-component system, chemotaxis family, chemotaxis protein CheY